MIALCLCRPREDVTLADAPCQRPLGHGRCHETFVSGKPVRWADETMHDLNEALLRRQGGPLPVPPQPRTEPPDPFARFTPEGMRAMAGIGRMMPPPPYSPQGEGNRTLDTVEYMSKVARGFNRGDRWGDQ